MLFLISNWKYLLHLQKRYSCESKNIFFICLLDVISFIKEMNGFEFLLEKKCHVFLLNINLSHVLKKAIGLVS